MKLYETYIEEREKNGNTNREYYKYMYKIIDSRKIKSVMDENKPNHVTRARALEDEQKRKVE